MKHGIGRRSTIAWRWVGMAFLLCYSSVQAADLLPLGRLLTTPNQRAQLDLLRKNTGKSIPQSPQNEDEVIVVLPKANTPTVTAAIPKTTNEAAKPVVFNGFVRRSDGIVTTWLNQQALTQPLPARALANSKDNNKDNNKDKHRQLQVHLPNGKYLHAKPGQTINPSEARVEDDLIHGKISITQSVPPTKERSP